MYVLPSPPLDFDETLCFRGSRQVRRPIASAKQFSYKSLSAFRNSTHRDCSRTTKIVHREFGLSTGSRFSAETPIDFATSQARNSRNYYKTSRLRAAVFRPNNIPFSAPRTLQKCFEHAACRLGRRHGRDGRHGCRASEGANANGRTTVVR